MKRRERGQRNSQPTDRYIGARIKMRRTALGMSQTALADRIGVTFQQVQKYERGVNRVGASRLQQIADVLEMPVAWFFERAGVKKDIDDDLAGFLADRRSPRLVRSFVKLPTRLKRSVVQLVERIAATGAA